MGHQRFLRDPVHGQIRFERVDLAAAAPAEDREGRQLSWVMQRLIDAAEFQRLRHIKQNGLTSFVFHGAEHTRFAHSLGVSYLAREMYHAITRNTDSPWDHECRLRTTCAALLHDVGHAPFSHTFEEILEEAGVKFSHEVMTIRVVLEDTQVNRILCEIDPQLPTLIAQFIDKDLRKEVDEQGRKKIPDHWSFRIVSSQLDADRLDYLNRDAAAAGVRGHGFDLPRLLDMLGHLDGERIAVDRRGLAAVEAYLMTLDQMYRAIYFHKTVRAASYLLGAAIRRAFDLFQNGDAAVFPAEHPLKTLFQKGQAIDTATYNRLTESHIWALLDNWTEHPDQILADLSKRVIGRRLFKAIDVDPLKVNILRETQSRVGEIVKAELHLSDDDLKYYVHIDEPSRTSYRRYDWRAEHPDESIFLTGGGKKALPIEEEQDSAIVAALRTTRYFHRLILPDFARSKLKEGATR